MDLDYPNQKRMLMTHQALMAETLQHMYNGEPWLDVTLMEHLSEMDASHATRRLNGSNNTWELLNHLIYWHQNVTRKLSGVKTEQEGDLPDFYLPENCNDENWDATLHRFHHSLEQMMNTIRNYPGQKLFDVVPGTQHTAYFYMQGILSHVAYHLGQIVLLRKYANIN